MDHSFIKDKWLIVEAYRNSAATSTLEEGYFHLLTDTTFGTNIFGQEDIYPMEINDEGWVQSLPQVIQYSVDVVHDDSLAISCEIQGFNFEFLVLRDTTTLLQ